MTGRGQACATPTTVPAYAGTTNCSAGVVSPLLLRLRLAERDLPFWGPLQPGEELGEFDGGARFGGEADWMQAGAEVPEGWHEWIESAEARGDTVPVLGQARDERDGVAEVKKRAPRRRKRA